MLGNAHGNNLLMNIALKTASKEFTLHKLIVLPTRFSKNKFIEYVHDIAHLPLSFNQRDFAFLKEADLQLCSAGILTVCPINVPIYDDKIPACEAQIFFQLSGEKPACKRKLPSIIAPQKCVGTAPCFGTISQSSVRSLYAVSMDLSG